MTMVQEMNDRSTPKRTEDKLTIWETLRRRPEMVTLTILVVICVAVSIINPNFLQPGSLIDMGRASVVTGLFALGVFAILAAGGSTSPLPRSRR